MKYRIVTDEYVGFKIQVWRRWLPFWITEGFGSYSTEAEALLKIKKLKSKNKIVYSE